MRWGSRRGVGLHDDGDDDCCQAENDKWEPGTNGVNFDPVKLDLPARQSRLLQQNEHAKAEQEHTDTEKDQMHETRMWEPPTRVNGTQLYVGVSRTCR